MAPTAFMEAVITRISTHWEDQGQVDASANPEEVARRMLAAVPRKHMELGEIVGPVYTTSSLEAMLGISRQAIQDRVKRGNLLRLTTNDDVSVYPAFQFDGKSLVPGLKQVLKILQNCDRWAVAMWLNSAEPTLGISPIEWLARGSDQSLVIDLAKDIESRWNRP